MRLFFIVSLLIILSSCGSGRHSYSPYKKFSAEKLQKDFSVYRETLEEAHPGLYWYTSRDSMDYYFAWGAAQLTDSMTEPEFRRVLNYVTAKINCGHTTVRSSKRYARFSDTVRIRRLFPLSLKIWDDSAVVSANINLRDSVLTRGTPILAINNVPIKEIVDSLSQFLSTDGFNNTHKHQTLSNRGYFGSLYSSIYGYSDRYEISYIDSNNQIAKTLIRPFVPVRDTTRRQGPPPPRPPQPSRRERKNIRRNAVRLLKIDSTEKVAMMDLNSFGRGYGLKRFFRRSFRALHRNDIEHLIIDVRSNGGGSVTNSTLLTRFIADKPFKVADSLYAPAKRKKYSRYIQNDFFNRLFITFFTKKIKREIIISGIMSDIRLSHAKKSLRGQNICADRRKFLQRHNIVCGHRTRTGKRDDHW
ncbi:MAG: S41 family peptidase [Chitinophagaceae bacterium]|nr:S41 family peptidase [Chitinophagaceae bacterium]